MQPNNPNDFDALCRLLREARWLILAIGVASVPIAKAITVHQLLP
jgi:hypothetical protein